MNANYPYESPLAVPVARYFASDKAASMRPGCGVRGACGYQWRVGVSGAAGLSGARGIVRGAEPHRFP
jgi:hypothetical protein